MSRMGLLTWKNMVTVATTTRLNMLLVWKRDLIATNWSLKVFHAVSLAQLWEVLGDGALLEQRLGLDLEELELDELVVRRKIAEAGEHAASLFLAAVVHQPTRREGHEYHADE